MTEHLPVLEALTQLAADNVADGGKPYSAIIIKDGVQIAAAVNLSHKIPDLTQHAELLAIQKACTILKTPDLSGCTLYASAQPCLMCHTAAKWAKIKQIYYIVQRESIPQSMLAPWMTSPLPEESLNYYPANQLFFYWDKAQQ